LQVCVVGPGALGCLHAYMLTRAGIHTCLLDHRPDRAWLIAQQGLTVDSREGTWTTRVRCTAEPAEARPADLLLFCVKTFQTASAARHAASLVGPQTVVVRLQNGLADPDPLVRLVGEARVVLGVSGQGANTVAWGHIRHAGDGPTRLGPLVPAGGEAATRAAEVLSRALPDVAVVADVPGMLWRKLLANVVINPLTALTGLRNGQLLDVPVLRAAMADLAAEAESVARAAGIDLSPGEGLALAEAACRQTAANRSSMLQDVSQSRPTEIDDLCGAVVREAGRLGLTAPLNAAMVRLVSEVCGSSSPNDAAP